MMKRACSPSRKAYHILSSYFILYVLDKLSRIATYNRIGCNILGHYGSCGHYGILADSHTGQDDGSHTNPGIATDMYGFAAQHHAVLEIVVVGDDAYVGANHHAVVDVLREDIKTCKPIRFDGNGYSDEWVEEAARRGLDVEKSCPKIFERYLDDSSVQMFESLGVMTKKELEARNEVKWETYTKKIQIEARVLGDLSMNHIIPVATRYQTQLLQNISNMAVVFPIDTADKLSARNKQIIQEIAERTSAIEKGVEDLVNARKQANKIEDEHQKAIAYHDTVEPKLDDIRYQIDKLELIVDDSLWPLPKYRELLFIR